MPSRANHLAQQQFGPRAGDYLSSDVHARGHSLRRLVEIVEPVPGWRVLDVATGAGHAAKAFAGEAALVVASDITHEMLVVARQHLQAEASSPIAVCQHNAAHLPYPAASFDLVVCRIAAHHFPGPGDFVREAARVLKPGGRLALADNVVSGEPKIAQYVNAFEKLRDPSHQWAYSLDDWETFFFSAGLKVTHREDFEKAMDFDAWASRMGVKGDDYTRLRALLEQAPRAPREWLKPQHIGQRLGFHLREGILVGQKAG